jgi:hypothetical protein
LKKVFFCRLGLRLALKFANSAQMKLKTNFSKKYKTSYEKVQNISPEKS